MVFPSETGEIPIPECELPKGQSIGRIAIVGTNLMFIFLIKIDYINLKLPGQVQLFCLISGHLAMAEAHEICATNWAQ